jgi:hypothetical protein
LLDERVLVYFAIVLICAVPNEADFEADNVHVRVNVSSNIYTYTVTNLGASPIVGFEIGEYHAYNFTAPEGWDKEVSNDVFRTWAGNTEAGIQSGKAADFSFRLSSAGGVLGYAPAKIIFQSGKVVNIAKLWTTVPEPRGYIFWVAVVILIILLLHTIVLFYRDRRRQKPFVNEP